MKVIIMSDATYFLTDLTDLTDVLVPTGNAAENQSTSADAVSSSASLVEPEIVAFSVWRLR
jgi:hypothetical protein